ncbi:MAG: 30S ribosomal protein S4 [Exilispira sp.]
MARNYENKCKLCRREGDKLFLKGDRCYSRKCPIDKKKLIKSRNMKLSDYGIQLREKQKIKRYYGVLERQFRVYFARALKIRQGLTGENLLSLLESRFDNAIYRMNLAKSRNQARQFVLHGMFAINGKKINIPSYNVKQDDIITLTQKGEKNKELQSIIEQNRETRPDVEWLTFDFEKKEGKILRMPVRRDVPQNFNEQLVVEFYSK